MDNVMQTIERNSAAVEIGMLKGMLIDKAQCANELVQAVKNGTMDPKVALEKSNKLETMAYEEYLGKLPLKIESL